MRGGLVAILQFPLLRFAVRSDARGGIDHGSSPKRDLELIERQRVLHRARRRHRRDRERSAVGFRLVECRGAARRAGYVKASIA